jgi:hypothetical protein
MVQSPNAKGERRAQLLAKLKDRSLRLTKAESDELGPVTARDLAPETGDTFVDELLAKQREEAHRG